MARTRRQRARGDRGRGIATLPGLVAGSLLLAFQLALAGGAGAGDRPPDTVARQVSAGAPERLASWRKVIHGYRDRAEAEKLRAVNRFFNRVRFLGDEENWGKRDYWATPLEMLRTNAGDCEDFSIAKYFTLREMGVPDERLRITYVRASGLDQVHMVLAYYPIAESEPLLLDNLTDAIRPASERGDLVPVYSFNAEGLWLATEGGGARRVAGPERIGPWRELAARMRKEPGMSALVRIETRPDAGTL